MWPIDSRNINNQFACFVANTNRYGPMFSKQVLPKRISQFTFCIAQTEPFGIDGSFDHRQAIHHGEFVSSLKQILETVHPGRLGLTKSTQYLLDFSFAKVGSTDIKKLAH